MAQQTTQPQRMVQDPNEVTLKDLYLLSKSHWWWYVLSVALCLAAATFYLLRTPKVYTRQASVLVKEASSSSSSLMNQLDGAAELGMFKEASNVNNEVLTIKMPAVILEVIQRLHLDYNYMVDGTFHKNVIYGSTLPIQANVDGLSDNSNLSFKLNLNKDGKYQISKFKFTNQPDGSATEFSGTVGDSIATPAGKLCISKSPYYDALTDDMEIYVTRTGLYAMQTAVRAKLNANISSKQATIIDLTYSDTNTQRAEEILNTVIAVSKENWVKDKNQVAVSTSEFISERLSVIEAELGNVDANISDYKSANLITNDAAQLPCI